MEKPKKERKFLKAIGKIAKTLGEELLLGIGRKFIGKVVDKVKIGKRERLSLLFLLSLSLSFASIDSIPYPITGNKQKLGFNTTGNGLVWRGLASDTVTKPTNYVDKNVKAYLVLDSTTGALFFWKQNKWATAMPYDSITFNTTKDGTVGVGEVEYNDSQGSLIQGLKGGNVTNVIGQQLHQRVSNVTGSTLSKGTAVYLSGSQGNRITAAKALATSDPTSANTFGIVAESIADNASGYVITEGLITGINTSGLTEDSAVYLSPTVAGGLTSTKPQAPNHGVYIGVCVKSNAVSGELFVKIKNGLELDELHDVLITSPSANASLYYSGGLWRDTTAALLVIDTASMLTNYLRSGVAASTYLPLTGGTLTGALNGTIGTFTGLNIDNALTEGILTLQGYDNNTPTRIQFKTDNKIRRQIVLSTSDSNLEFRTSTIGGTEGGYSFYTRRNPNAEQLAFNIDYNKDIQMYGALSVSSTTTLTGALTVNNATVLNEGSGDYDTRIESDGNANMVFVDASTNRVGIGTATPSKTLDVVGTLGVSGVATFAGNTVIDGGLKAKILKESGTGGFFNQIPSDVVTYIFEYTGATTGGGSTDFLGSPSSHTNRIINIINVSDVDYYLGFMTNLPYIKTNTTISELDYGQSMTVQSDGSKWWVISRNF
jgi:hypothetical protein